VTFRSDIAALAGAVAILGLLAAGCASSLTGVYENDNGAISVEFRSGKAYVTMLAGTLEVDYQVKQNKIILTNHGGNIVLTRHADGTLEGPMGRMRRKGSSDRAFRRSPSSP
jgi:hypothetical protein